MCCTRASRTRNTGPAPFWSSWCRRGGWAARAGKGFTSIDWGTPPLPRHGDPCTSWEENMDFGLTQEQRLIQQTVREFANEKLAPLAGENERTEEVTRPHA